MINEIDFELVSARGGFTDAEGYHAADYFTGGIATIRAAAQARTPKKADAILRAAYKGPDVAGVEVRWTIEPTA